MSALKYREFCESTSALLRKSKQASKFSNRYSIGLPFCKKIIAIKLQVSQSLWEHFLNSSLSSPKLSLEMVRASSSLSRLSKYCPCGNIFGYLLLKVAGDLEDALQPLLYVVKVVYIAHFAGFIFIDI